MIAQPLQVREAAPETPHPRNQKERRHDEEPQELRRAELQSLGHYEPVCVICVSVATPCAGSAAGRGFRLRFAIAVFHRRDRSAALPSSRRAAAHQARREWSGRSADRRPCADPRGRRRSRLAERERCHLIADPRHVLVVVRTHRHDEAMPSTPRHRPATRHRVAAPAAGPVPPRRAGSSRKAAFAAASRMSASASLARGVAATVVVAPQSSMRRWLGMRMSSDNDRRSARQVVRERRRWREAIDRSS